MTLGTDTKLLNFVANSQDGYCIISANDTVEYCNEQFADAFSIPAEDVTGMPFEGLLRRGFELNRGINIEASSIEEFITYTRRVRRSRPFRLFEVDLTDGRWFLFSEQTNSVGEMLVQTKDITKQKILALDLEQSVDKLTKLSLTDELTRIGNRRALIDSVDMELSRCRRTGASMSLLILDLDFFKKVNDTYGHLAGDAALVHVTRIIQNSLRQYDILGRIGGEEFAVFLSNTTIEKSMEIAERIRSSIELNLLNYEGRDIALTVSIGQTTLGCNALFTELYDQADQALYKAKTNGRNQVVSYYS
ncbi:MAG: GGDEF domain-containing protein [Cellvibrionaceae bacterium]|nr:GGDEF domain-containing protein [Cellvibrionaceae bacterium]|tara:strand:+ start:1547 stop:2461 length:915 start_codon:yes stop_codon:yes gene_type:complete